MPLISLVIPAHNEEEFLPRLLGTVEEARSRFRLGRDAVELIVGNNASTDRTAQIAADKGCRVVQVEERRIATVRNHAAAEGRGSILCFVDADMRIHPESFNAIADCMDSGRYVAGSTGVWLERWSPGIIVTWILFMPFVWALRMDTGVVFCRREDFEAIGGYDERRYFGEDVQLFVDLKALGRGRGQRLVRLRSVKAISSCRKFDSHGDWHYFTGLSRLLPLMVKSPNATSEFAERFWYGEQRTPRKR
jgi:glycosyltransferase involved in cell wall biosynthesis